jgi:LPS sulfotransferase NodH
MLLGRSRTGSNFVRGLLNSHPQVVAFGEIFRSDETIEWGLDGYPTGRKALKLLQTDPPEFLEELVFGKYPRETAAVGFKIFYYHAQKDGLNAIWPHLQAQTGIRVLHIKRRNVLRTHLSRERAALTDRWANVDGVREKEQSIALDYERCLQDFVQTRQWETDFDRAFSNHPKIDVVYEDLVANFGQEVLRIQDFLGVEREPLKTDTHRQSLEPLTNAIVNYAELKERFDGTAWEEFFREPA